MNDPKQALSQRRPNSTPHVRSVGVAEDVSDSSTVGQAEAPLSAGWLERFGGIYRLYGAAGAARLAGATVAVVGLGGVGSWVVESLARTGIGGLRLIDLDDICVTNVNRQLPATSATIGKSKARVLAERVREISPTCRLKVCQAFFTRESAAELLAGSLDYVVDAIDTRKHKVELLAAAAALGLPVISCGAAGGRRDATAARVSDLTRVRGDALLNLVRKNLRERHGFPRGDQKKPKPFRIEAVYSEELPVYPHCDGSVSTERETQAGASEDRAAGRNVARGGGPSGLNCAGGLGSVTHVTGLFGLIAAGRVVQHLATDTAPIPRLPWGGKGLTDVPEK